MSDHMLSEEKTKSILVPSQDKTLLSYPVINNRRDLQSWSYDFGTF